MNCGTSDWATTSTIVYPAFGKINDNTKLTADYYFTICNTHNYNLAYKTYSRLYDQFGHMIDEVDHLEVMPFSILTSDLRMFLYQLYTATGQFVVFGDTIVSDNLATRSLGSSIITIVK